MHDEDAENPRKVNDTIGLFLTKESKYHSPDGNTHALYQIMLETESEAKDTEDHMELIKKEAKKQNIPLTSIYPINRYEHSGIIYRRGVRHGFDYSNCGFYFMLKKGVKNEKEIIDEELNDYNKWANGEIYSYTLHDAQGKEIDTYGGFYSIEDMRENLPEEYKKENLQDYFINNL